MSLVRKRYLVGVLLILILGGWAYWWVQQLWQPTADRTQTPVAPTVVAGQACGLPAEDGVEADVEAPILNGKLAPQHLTQGQTILWINKGDKPLTMRSIRHGKQSVCAGFEATVIESGEQRRFTFLRKGDWYFQVDDGPATLVKVDPAKD